MSDAGDDIDVLGGYVPLPAMRSIARMGPRDDVLTRTQG